MPSSVAEVGSGMASSIMPSSVMEVGSGMASTVGVTMGSTPGSDGCDAAPQAVRTSAVRPASNKRIDLVTWLSFTIKAAARTGRYGVLE